MIKADEWRGKAAIPWTVDDDAALDGALEQGVTADSVVKGFRVLIRAGGRPERSIREIADRIRLRHPGTGPLLMQAIESLANSEFKPPRAAVVLPSPPPPPRTAPALRSMPPPPPAARPEIALPDDEWQPMEEIVALVHRNEVTIRGWAKQGIVKRKPTGNPRRDACQWLYSVKQCKRAARSSPPRDRSQPYVAPLPMPVAAPIPPPRPQPNRTTALEAHIWAERDAGLITDAQALDMLRALRGGR